MTEKVFEILEQDGGFVLALRPPLPFLADEALVLRGSHENDMSSLVLRGEGRRLAFPVDEVRAAAVQEAGQVQVLEYEQGGETPVRETIIDIL